MTHSLCVFLLNCIIGPLLILLRLLISPWNKFATNTRKVYRGGYQRELWLPLLASYMFFAYSRVRYIKALRDIYFHVNGSERRDFPSKFPHKFVLFHLARKI